MQSTCLGRLGRWEKALAASTRAVEIFQALAKVDSAHFQPDLAAARQLKDSIEAKDIG
ncbi:hypothetical protein [Streptomyces sp. NBC_00728]|uniref:hypothetical protein n=1 Tax=Streptomyces sp. NBC_00728 TaxID=2903676 RepID=UPI00386480A2